ncbi:LOW QUALITY PROTEIN: hypothetical protein PHMEG_0003382 [Phytophthora megakarya]|uniref:Uncharacterized protein n=1 Tax=Phytophthora megakarya TaxID=4795 RepID=A0A225WWB6_9STRA|nr:LOW QUALITY PROTEIN: hypothetical protein PHMEG_0003382 [Phytophthora megakarya]
MPEENWTWLELKYQINYKLKAGKATVYICSSHLSYCRIARFTEIEDGFVTVLVTGEHSETISYTPRTGIDKRFEAEVDNMLLGGAPPSRCLMLLSERYEDDTVLRELLQDAVQRRNHSTHLYNKGLFDIRTYAEMMEWGSDKMCTTMDRFYS